MLQFMFAFASTKPSNKDFIQESIVPSDHFQKSLPRLPIPKLEDTCARYLKSQAVLQNEKEHTATKKLTDEFMNGDGKSNFFYQSTKLN